MRMRILEIGKETECRIIHLNGRMLSESAQDDVKGRVVIKIVLSSLVSTADLVVYSLIRYSSQFLPSSVK